MQYLRAHILTPLVVATLSCWALPVTIAFDDDGPVAKISSWEETEERVDMIDFDDEDAMVGLGISILDVGSLYVQLDPRHENPLHAHAWRWCSRGPPLV